MKTALAITHVAFEDLGSLAGVLKNCDFSIEYCDATTADLQSIDACAPDLLVVLGGPIGVYESASYPFVHDEIALLSKRLARRLPTLGICLGSQLMAAALGGRVHPGGNGKEIGWAPVFAAPDAQASNPLRPLFEPDVKVLHWHGDTFELPAEVRLLASSAQYPYQGFAVGEYALALQFHAEAQATALERWYVGHACELAHAGIDVSVLRAQSREEAPKLELQATLLWKGWLERAFAAVTR